MRIVVGHINSKVYTKDPRALVVVRGVCKARPSGYQFSSKFRDGSWDGYISLMGSYSEFPTGLLSVVLSALKVKGYKVTVHWGDYHLESHIVFNPDILHGIHLRDYQMDAAIKLLNARRGVARMATNSGKTEVFAAILKVLEGKQALVIVHRKELLHQTAERLEERLGIKVGKIGDGLRQPLEVTVAMVQTLHNMMESPETQELVKGNEIVVIDECHHASSNQMMDVLFKVPGMYRYGFSGTPLKDDDLADMKLISATGRVLVNVTNADLIAGGYSAVPTVHLHAVVSNSKDDWDEDYHSAYQKQIVDSFDRNSKIIDLAKHRSGWGDVVLILVNRIKHGNFLSFETEGMYSTGEHTTEHRQHMLSQMKKGVPGVYVATTIFDEGVDVPSINALILAGGGKSDLKLLQRIGRGMRAKDGENVIHIYDFIDDTNKYLLKHTEERVDVYVKEGFEIVTDPIKTTTNKTLPGSV